MKVLANFWVFFLLLLSPKIIFAEDLTPSMTPLTPPFVPPAGATAIESPAPLPVIPDTSLAPEPTAGESKFKNPHYALTSGIQVPQPLTLGVQVNWDSIPQLKAFFEGGYFKYSLSKGRDISEYSFMGGVHYHPYLNWFYVGGSLGYRHLGFVADISSLKTDTGEVIASDASLSLNALFLALFVGGEWSLSPRVSFEFDLGAQFSMLHGGNITILPNPGSPPLNLDVTYEQTTDRLSGFPLPQIALARFVWKL